MPLHPIIVHFPIVLSFLIPIGMLGLIVASNKIKDQRTAWIVISGLCVMLTASSFASMAAGEYDEERVEKVVQESVIEEHEEGAELFSWLTILPLIFSLLFVYKNRPGFRGGAVASSLFVALLAIMVGHTGGELVYEHNAGSAFSKSASAIALQGDGYFGRGDHDYDDD